MFDFQRLTVYVKAKEFHMACKALIADHSLDHYVSNQLGRASLSIPLNIAEGSGKFSKADRKNYFTTARASVFECIAIIDILQDQSIVSSAQAVILFNQADELSRILYAMIRNLSK